MSPDGTSLLTAVYDNEHEDEGHIFIYTTSSWTRVKILSYPSIPRAAEYSPDTEAFFVGLESGLLMAYDPVKNKEKWTADLNSPILSLAVSPDSRTLAAGFADGRLLFLDTATGNLLDEKKIGTIKINSLVWAPGKGCLFAGGRDSSEKEDREDQPGYLFALDAATLDTLWSNRSLKYLVSDMVWNPQTDSIAVSMGHVWSGAFSVFTGDGDRAWRTRGNSKRITDLSYIPATDELLVVGETGYIPETEIISTIDFIPELPSWGHGAWASLSPDGDFVYAGMPDLNPSYLMERKSGKILAEYPENNLWVKPPPVFSPEGTYLVLSSFFDNPGRNSDWLLSLRNLERERLVMNLAFQDREIYDYTLSPDGRTLAVATGSNYENRGEIIVYDAATGKETLSREFDVRVLSLDYSPDGERLAIGLDYLEEESEGTLRILSASTLKTLSRSAGTVGTRVVSYSPDGLWIASGTSMGDVIVWKPSHPAENINVHLHTAAVSDCVWSPDGGLLFTGAGDGNVCIYNFRTGDYATLVMAGPEWIMFTPDGYFDASRNGGSLVALVKDDAAYGIDQFALALNRPDIILERLESSAQEVIDHYRSQYRKRMRRLGLSAEEGNVT